MSNLVKNSYPLHCRRISHMIGSGYFFLLTTLFKSPKSLTQHTLPSFGGSINIGEAHSLATCGDKTPIFTKCSYSFLKALRCITGTGYGLVCLAMAPGTKSIWDFLWDKHPIFHQIVWYAPLKHFLGPPGIWDLSCIASWIMLVHAKKFVFLLDFFYFIHCFKLLIWRRWGLHNGNSLSNHSMVPVLYLTSMPTFVKKISPPNDIVLASLWLKYKWLLLVNISVFIKLR